MIFSTRIRARSAALQPGGLLVVLLAALCLGAAAPGNAASDLAEARLAEASADCEGLDGGVFSTDGAAITEVDLTGDAIPDEIIDEGTFRCSSAASLWCGTGGCGLTVIAEGTATQLLVKDWRVIDWHDRKILLTAVHGHECGGSNLRWCYEALVWSEGALRSVSPFRRGE
ncbi:hypothetical protein M1105_06255 [Limibaculum sp. FT325]|uniref:hypothetical protein n=1 Tax=Thermohalobaculum sediminis TaxID=2939436 RepID=UPI0020BEA190|nr:hypothetical protein [Limibaculum sediminis]MCL5776589.1 hypothetical protein [Limibaculum sediminis]